jgi:hypothetical protein
MTCQRVQRAAELQQGSDTGGRVCGSAVSEQHHVATLTGQSVSTAYVCMLPTHHQRVVVGSLRAPEGLGTSSCLGPRDVHVMFSAALWDVHGRLL